MTTYPLIKAPQYKVRRLNDVVGDTLDGGVAAGRDEDLCRAHNFHPGLHHF